MGIAMPSSNYYRIGKYSKEVCIDDYVITTVADRPVFGKVVGFTPTRVKIMYLSFLSGANSAGLYYFVDKVTTDSVKVLTLGADKTKVESLFQMRSNILKKHSKECSKIERRIKI